MELDVTFKPGKPCDLKKDRQFKERLCFNCDKPGHIARDYRQPKKGNGGRKSGKQLNATWQGQLNATFRGQQDWGINGNSTPEEESSEEESEAKSLTTSEQETYDELAPKESMNLQCKEIVKDMAKFTHAKIKKARKEPDGATLDAERKVSMIKSIYKSSLHKVPRQVLAKDQGDDL
ncbi:hypothetical protein VF21_10639 [Pseudogymnoascus sp. 05NY08]|nr:hypothetical protein VF21_10639 [Pseudogymnoascus sp. 05NY08]